MGLRYDTYLKAGWEGLCRGGGGALMMLIIMTVGSIHTSKRRGRGAEGGFSGKHVRGIDCRKGCKRFGV